MNLSKFVLVAAMLLAAVPVASAQPTLAEIAGPWDLKIDAMGREMNMTLILGEQGGEPTVKIESPQGPQEATNVSYKDGTLSWAIEFGPQELQLAVQVEGQTFAGTAETPFGTIQLAGTKLDQAAIDARMAKFDAIIGDWTVISTFNEEEFETNIRFQEVNGQIEGSLEVSGVDSGLENVMLEGDKLSWFVALPFVANRAARAEVTLDGEGKFAGLLRSELGEIPLQGELVDTRKLVLSPYDDPTPIIGEWSVETEINGELGTAKLKFYEADERLHATITTDQGELQSERVEYKKISDTMSVAKVFVAIPDYGADPLSFELIIDGTSFTGEEVTAEGLEFLVSGEKTS